MDRCHRVPKAWSCLVMALQLLLQVELINLWPGHRVALPFILARITRPAHVLAPGASTWGTPSDVRLKENIRDLGYGLNAVLAMKPLVYNYKGNSASQKAIGFIAQDMLAVVPEVVNLPKDPVEMMGIRYSELVPVLAKAIQDLKQEKDREIHDLRNENAELKAENHRLSTVIAKMDNLEKAVNALQIKVSTQPIAYDK